MKHVFYALIILQALYELAKLFRCKSFYQHAKVFQDLDKTSKRWYLMAHPWLHIALFSSQWMCFLIVLAMSFSQIQKLGVWAIFLDSLVTVIIYSFTILNAYHLA